MKKCCYIVLAAAAIVASCAKVDLKEDQKIEPKDGATALFSGTIIQPNGLGSTKVSIVEETNDLVEILWDKGDQIWVKFLDDPWSDTFENHKKLYAVTASADTQFIGAPEGWASSTNGYSARYFGKNNAWKEYVFATSIHGGFQPEQVSVDCGVSENAIPVLLENMPLYDDTSADKEDGSHYFEFSCEYAILQITVPSKLDFDDLYVCTSIEGVGMSQDVTFENGVLKEGSDYSFRLINAANLKTISKYADKSYVTYFVPVPVESYSYIQVVAVKGSLEGHNAEEVARMKTYEYSGDSAKPFAADLNPNNIYFFDFCNTLTIKKAGTYNLVSNDNISGDVTINAETENYPDSIFINNHGFTVGKLTINASKSHVECEKGVATVVESKTSNSTFVVKPTLHIGGLTVAKGSVVVDAGDGAANVKQIIIPEEAEGTITIDVTGVRGGQESERVEIVNYSAKEKVLVVADEKDKDKEYYVTAGPVTEVTKETVATIGDKGYATLADAVAAVPTDGPETTITMIGNDYYEDNNPITIGKNQKVILDLNGKTVSAISSKDEASALITNKGYLTIKDSGTEGCLVMLAKSPDGREIPGYASNTVTNCGQLVVENGIIRNNTKSAIGQACYPIDNQTNGDLYSPCVTINGGRIISVSNAALRLCCNSTTNDNAATINGGYFEAVYYALQIRSLNAYANKGTVVINDGEFEATATEYNCSVCCNANNSEAVSLTVNGGKFNDHIATKAECDLRRFVQI